MTARVVMGIVFFGVVTPIAFVFLVTGRDALERTLDRGAATYWRRRSPVVDEARYYRQFYKTIREGGDGPER